MSINRVYAEISLANIEHNLNLICKQMPSYCKVILVVKADGYGHGAAAIAQRFEYRKDVYGFAVATFEEALALRNVGISKPILILGYTFPEDYEEMIRLDITPAVFDEASLIQLEEKAEKACKKVKVHVKVDTGMSRIGIAPMEEGIAFLQKLSERKMLEPEGIFTHFAKADEYDKSSAYRQLQIFKNFIEEAENSVPIKFATKHCANSAGIFSVDTGHMDAVRAGIVLYGLIPGDDMSEQLKELRPALSMFSSIIYIKVIKKGTEVSYGGTFVADKDMKVATVPVGYGDGYPRSLSSKGHVLVRGQIAPIIGRICMDQFMIDVTHIENVKTGDKVTLIGTDQEEKITVEDLGKLSGRFNYEFVCDISKRVPRVYID